MGKFLAKSIPRQVISMMTHKSAIQATTIIKIMSKISNSSSSSLSIYPSMKRTYQDDCQLDCSSGVE